jgi:uncharacterized glyoxalase superfamily protein PhnB
MTISPQLNALSVVVQDMGRSMAFYRLCGLPIPDRAATESHVEVALGEDFRIQFDTVEVVRSFDPEWSPPTGGHRMALAFACDTPAEVDSTHAELLAAGHPSHLAPFDAVWGQRYATVQDPDGNPVDFYAPLG